MITEVLLLLLTGVAFSGQTDYRSEALPAWHLAGAFGPSLTIKDCGWETCPYPGYDVEVWASAGAGTAWLLAGVEGRMHSIPYAGLDRTLWLHGFMGLEGGSEVLRLGGFASLGTPRHGGGLRLVWRPLLTTRGRHHGPELWVAAYPDRTGEGPSLPTGPTEYQVSLRYSLDIIRGGESERLVGADPGSRVAAASGFVVGGLAIAELLWMTSLYIIFSEPDY